MGIEKQAIVDAFSDCVGQAKAETVIEEVAADIGLDDRTEYDKAEAIELSVRIANRERTTPFVRTAAHTLQTRIETGNV